VARVRFENAGKVYDDGTRALRELNLEVDDGEFMVIVGPSGCGKTTAMRLVAGLETITEGNIWIGERVVNRITPKERDIAMVFQNYALYPQMSVFANIAFPLRMEKRPRAEIKASVNDVAKSLGLVELLNRKPGQLSGGQRQRVAMGRAIVRNPQVFLMDEPLSNLDAKLRVQMRGEMLRLQRELGVTAIYVTHDQVEAMTMGDRVAVLRDGVLQQVDSGQRLYDKPAKLFVATFIGSPAMNVMHGRIDVVDGTMSCHVGAYEFELPAVLVGEFPRLREYAGRVVAIGIRPEAIQEAAMTQGMPEERRWHLTGEIRLIESLGAEFLLHVATKLESWTSGEEATNGDQEPLDSHGAADRNVMVARVGSESVAMLGQPIELSFDLTKLHFFDIDTGESLRER